MALDNFRTIELIWDRANKSIIKTIKTASSDTTGRYLSVKILDGGQEVTLNNAKLQLYWEHPNFNTSGTDDFNTVNNGGLFKMTFSKEMLTNIGKLNAHLVLTLPDGNITSDGFPIEVIKGADDGVVVPTNGKGLVEQIDGKIDKGNVTLEDLTQEVKLAMTGGSVAVVGENAVGTENIKDGAVTIEKIADNAVTPATTTFMTSVTASKNLFNPNDSDIIEGKILNTDGSFSDNSAYNTSGFISVSPGDKISISKNDSGNTVLARAYGFYDENGNWLTGYSAPTNPDLPLTVPENAYIFRVTYSTTSYNEYQVEIGEVPTSYEPYIDNHLVDGNVKLSMDSLTGEDGVFSLEPASKNLFNPNDPGIVLGTILTTSGGFTNNNAYNVTGFIPVKKGDKVYVSKKTTTSILVRSYGWYDKQKNWIEGKTWSSGNLLNPPFIAQEDGYFRATYTNSDNEEYQIEIGDGVTSYEPFVLKNFFNSQKVGIPENASIGNTGKSVNDLLTYWYGKKVVFQGDSITAGYLPTSYNEDAPSYAKLTSDELGMMYSNFAIGGSTIAENPELPTEKDPIVNRYQLQDDGADLVIIAAGTNDWSYAWTPIGSMDDRSKNTFYGALHYLILGLLDKYPDKQLLFMTPIKRRSDPIITNANGKTLEEYADIIKEVCGFYGIPVLDMFRECSILPHLESHRSLYIPDEVHPNGAGHIIMARRVTGYLKQLA